MSRLLDELNWDDIELEDWTEEEKEAAWKETMDLLAEKCEQIEAQDREQREKYDTCFLKKRILKEWQQHRNALVHRHTLNLDQDIERACRALDCMNNMLRMAYESDEHDTFTYAGLHWWLVSLELMTQEDGKRFDSMLWREIHEWLEDLRDCRIIEEETAG